MDISITSLQDKKISHATIMPIAEDCARILQKHLKDHSDKISSDLYSVEICHTDAYKMTLTINGTDKINVLVTSHGYASLNENGKQPKYNLNSENELKNFVSNLIGIWRDKQDAKARLNPSQSSLSP